MNRYIVTFKTMSKTQVEIEQVAKVCHETNRAYCETIGDFTQNPWEVALDWQKESAIRGVQFRINNPDATPESQHEAWMNDKLADGWVYGPEKNAEKKTHHCLVPYSELPENQRKKDALFVGVCNALL